jgi:hypothetical protein
MAKFINQDQAAVYRQSIEDPIVRGLCYEATTHLMMNEVEFDGDFDMLFHLKMIHMLVKNKESLMRYLGGDNSDEVFVG